jgi:arylsulfatase
MANELTNVLVAGYQSVEAASTDFDGLIEQVKAKQVRIDAAILVAHDANGNVTVQKTGDNVGRTGAKWGGAVGFLVGLAAPPLLAATVVGAVGGAILGKAVDRKVEQTLHDKLGEAMKPGTAAIIAMFDADQRLAVERALPNSPAKSVVETDQKGTKALQASLGEAMGKFVQDRSALPIPDRTFGGVAGRTLRDSVPDWLMIPGAKAPDDAPNVLLVLIDDAGYGAPETFGGPIRTPTFTRVQGMGLTYNRFHVTAVC